MIAVNSMWQELIRYYGITEEDLRILKDNEDFFRTHAPSVVDAFYSELVSHENLARLIRENSTLERLKETQIRYFHTLGSDVIDDDYIRYRQHIGSVHARIGLSASWYMGGNALYQRLVHDLVKREERGLDFFHAVSKRLLFDSAVILEQYIGDTQRENLAFRRDMEYVSNELVQAMGQVSAISAEYARSSMTLTDTQESIARSVEDLKRCSREIESLSRFVQDVASQTNLLGLNAAIEAARAGEYGRGFAVVADEVRKLADRAKKSSEEIQESVVRILRLIDQIGERVNGALSASEEQAAAAEELRALIESLEQLAGRLNVS